MCLLTSFARWVLSNQLGTMGRPSTEDIAIQGTADTERIEAPVTVRAYLICAFAAFGGIFFGYDTGKS